MRYLIAHNGNDVVHYMQIENNQSFTTGQPNVEEFDSEEDWLNRLGELGIDPNADPEPIERPLSDIEKAKKELRAEFDQKLEQRVNQIAEAVASGARGQELADKMRKK